MFFRTDEQKLFIELRSLGDRLAEDRIYEIVVSEVDRDELDPVAKARAFEEAEGDSQKTKALYIKHRVRRIRDLAAEYEIWLQKEEATKAALAKAVQQQARHRQILAEKLNNGEMPPKEIQKIYKAEFSQFYLSWIKQDYAIKFVPKAAAWKEFLLSIDLID